MPVTKSHVAIFICACIGQLCLSGCGGGTKSAHQTPPVIKINDIPIAAGLTPVDKVIVDPLGDDFYLLRGASHRDLPKEEILAVLSCRANKLSPETGMKNWEFEGFSIVFSTNRAETLKLGELKVRLTNDSKRNNRKIGVTWRIGRIDSIHERIVHKDGVLTLRTGR